MALKLSQDTPQGVTADYWRIDTLQWDKSTASASLMLGLYKDQATAKTDGSQPISRRGVRVTGIDSAETLAACYAALKKPAPRTVRKSDGKGGVTESTVETNPFVNATDC